MKALLQATIETCLSGASEEIGGRGSLAVRSVFRGRSATPQAGIESTEAG
jgi:hypothetical protein